MQPTFQQANRRNASWGSEFESSPSGFQSGETVKGLAKAANSTDIEMLNTELAKILAKDANNNDESKSGSPFKDICKQIDQVAERLTFSPSHGSDSHQKDDQIMPQSWLIEGNSTFGENAQPHGQTLASHNSREMGQKMHSGATQIATFRKEEKASQDDPKNPPFSQQSNTEDYVDLTQYITSKAKSPQTLNSGSDKNDLVAYFAKRAEDDMFLEDCGSSMDRDRLRHMRSPDDIDNRSLKTVDESLFKKVMNQVDTAVDSGGKENSSQPNTKRMETRPKPAPTKLFKSYKIETEQHNMDRNKQNIAESIENIVIKPKLLPEESLSQTGGRNDMKQMLSSAPTRPLPPLPTTGVAAGSSQDRVAVGTSHPKVLKLVSRGQEATGPISPMVSVETSAQRDHKLPQKDSSSTPSETKVGTAGRRSQMAREPPTGSRVPVNSHSWKKEGTPNMDPPSSYLVEMRLAELSTKMSYLLKRHSSNPDTLLLLIKTVIEDLQSDALVYRECIKECPELETRIESLKKTSSDAKKVLQSVCTVIPAEENEVEERQEIEKFLLKRVHKQAALVIGSIQSLQSDIWKSSPRPKISQRSDEPDHLSPKVREQESFDQEFQGLIVKKEEHRGLHRVPSVNSRLNFSGEDFGRNSFGKENRCPNKLAKLTKEIQTSTIKPSAARGSKRTDSKAKCARVPEGSGAGRTIYEQILAGEAPADGVRQTKHLAACAPPGEQLTSQKFGCRIFSLQVVQHKWLAAGFEDGGLSVFSICPKEGLSLQRSGKLHPRPITALCCSPIHHKRQLLFAGYAGSTAASVVVWDFHTMKPLKELVGHTATISSLQFIEPGYLASTSFDRRVIFWDLEESAAVLAVETLKSPILSSMYDSDSRVLYAGALDGAISALGLVFDEGPAGELADCVQLQLLAGQSPVLHLSSYLGDKLLAVQNAKIAIFDSRGIPFREIRTDTLPNSLQILSEDRGVLTDSTGKPFVLDMGELLARGPKTPGELKLGLKPTASDNTSNLLALRLSGANCQAQFLPEGAFQIQGTLVVSVGEKHDTVFLYKIR